MYIYLLQFFDVFVFFVYLIRNCSEDQKQAWLNILDDWDSCKTKLTKVFFNFVY